MANDLYQLVILTTGGGQPMANVLHFESNVAMSSTPVTDAQHLVSAWQAGPESHFLDLLSSDVFLVGYKAKRVNNGGGATFASPQASIPGNDTGGFGASATGAILSSPVLLAGKNVTGKIFVPPCASNSMADNDFTTGYRTLLVTMEAQLLGTFGSAPGPWTYVIMHKPTKDFAKPTAINISFKIGNLNRRLLPSF